MNKASLLLPKGVYEHYIDHLNIRHFRIHTNLEEIAYDIVTISVSNEYLRKNKFHDYMQKLAMLICDERNMHVEKVNGRVLSFVFYYEKKPKLKLNKSPNYSIKADNSDIMLLNRVSVRRK